MIAVSEVSPSHLSVSLHCAFDPDGTLSGLAFTVLCPLLQSM